ncbi:ecdysone-induced protein 74EF isoform B [Trichonephila clavipes]|nr:ecdysone-induced protein 74EF isoform B [Trichonephila clavipes]
MKEVDNSCDSTRGDPRDQEIVAEALLHSPENMDREAKTLLQNILQQSPQRLPYTLASMYGPHATVGSANNLFLGKQKRARDLSFEIRWVDSGERSSAGLPGNFYLFL